MTLENTLTKNLSEWRPEGRDTLLVTDKNSPWTVQATAERCELLGAQLWELAVTRPTAPANVKLCDWAARIAAKTVGLLEPLKVLEVDELSQQALLRSQAPAQADGKLFYYEVLVKGTTAANLRRFQANPDGTPRREQVSFVLTHEVIARVVTALTAQA